MSQKVKVIVDHDADTNPDDILAVLFLLNSPDVEICLTVSGNNHPVERAQYMKRFLELTGHPDIPCFAGEQTGHITFHGHDAIRDSNYQPPIDYKAAIKHLCEENNKVIYLCIQNLANLHALLNTYREIAPKIQIFHMGMSLDKAKQSFVSGGTNMEGAPLAAKAVYERTDLDMHVVGAHTTIHDSLRISPETELHQKLKLSDKPHEQFAWKALTDFYKRRNIWPALHDPLTASCAAGCEFVKFSQTYIDFRENGTYQLGIMTDVVISEHADYTGFMRYFASIL